MVQRAPRWWFVAAFWHAVTAMAPPNTTLYLDHAATTPLRPEAREAMAPYLGDAYGNPSGIHAVSRVAKKALEEARERAAVLLGADHPLDVVFTGGGTESDNLGVAGPSLASGGGVVTTRVEHEAVLETAAFLGRLGRSVTVIHGPATRRFGVAGTLEGSPGVSVVSGHCGRSRRGT